MRLLVVSVCASILAALGVGCVPTTSYSTRQSTLVTLPTAPPAAADSGGIGVDLGALVPTDTGALPASDSGIAAPVAEPFGGLSVRLAEFVALRGFFAVAPAEGQRQLAGSLEGPTSSAYNLGLGASFRFRFFDDVLFIDAAPSAGFAVLPSRQVIARTDLCDDGEPCGDPDIYGLGFYEAMPFLAVSLRLGVRPFRWLALRGGITVRNQPTNDGAFVTADEPGSTVSPGAFGLLVHAAVEVDVIDELGFRAEVTWPAVGFDVPYGPMLGFAVQGRFDGSQDEPFGLSI